MADRRIPIGETAGFAFASGTSALSRFRASTIAVTTVLLLINYSVVSFGTGNSLAAQACAGVFGSLLSAIVLAPFAILICRALILRDYTGTYWTMATHRRARHFVAVALLLVLARDLAGALNALDRYSEWLGVLGAICTIASIVLWVRVCLAFPAIATDASGMALRDSFRYARGSGVDIFLVLSFAGALFGTPLVLDQFGLFPRTFSDWPNLITENPVLLLIVRAFSQYAATMLFAVYIAALAQLWKTRADWSRAFIRASAADSVEGVDRAGADPLSSSP